MMSNMHQEQQAITLYQVEGMSIAKIMKATGLPERKVKFLTSGLSKPHKVKKERKVVTKISTTLTKAVNRVYPLAIRQQGIRDYELHDILHQEYGSTWDTSKGKYVSNYNSDNKKRVKEKVRLRAEHENNNALFVMDWVDEVEPKVSMMFLQAAANDITSRIDNYANEFMERHAIRWEEDSEEVDYAQRKQMFAARRHLLKMVAPASGKEPLDKLIDRCVNITDALEGTPDTPMARSIYEGSWYDELPEYYPEPTKNDAFLDYAESQGWLKEVEDRFV